MSARADLCGGRSEMIVPTATSIHPCSSLAIGFSSPVGKRKALACAGAFCCSNDSYLFGQQIGTEGCVCLAASPCSCSRDWGISLGRGLLRASRAEWIGVGGKRPADGRGTGARLPRL